MGSEFRAAIKSLFKRPGLTCPALVTLAFGVGASTLLFSILNGVLLRPLPFANADRLYRAAELDGNPSGDVWRSASMMGDTFVGWAESTTTIEQVAAWVPRPMTLRAADGPARVEGAFVTANMFETLGVGPAAGRLFQPADGVRGVRAAVVSHRMWRTRFAADPAIVGSALVLDDRPHTVVGVAPPDFYFPSRDTDVWTLFALGRSVPSDGGGRQRFSAHVLALLRPGVESSVAADEATAIARGLPGARASATPRVELRGLKETMTAEVGGGLVLLMAAVVAVLMIASANVANLLLVRSMGRRRELALRAALGASAGRIARELVAESVVLGLLAGGTGLLLAWWLHQALPALMPAGFPRVDEIVFDWRVFLFGVAASMCAGLLCATAPALHGARLNLADTLNEDGGTPALAVRQRGMGRVRALMLTAEVALSCALLVSAVLLAKSFANLMSVDPGYDSGVLTAQLALRPRTSAPEQQRIVGTLLERLQKIPSVEAAGITNVLPLVPDRVLTDVKPRTALDPASGRVLHLRVVTPGFLDAMGMRVVQGRAFSPRDTAADPPVVMANEAFVRRYGYGVGDVLGRGETLIGIVADVHAAALDQPVEPEIYQSFLQAPAIFLDRIHVAVRTTGDPAAFAPTLRALAGELFPAEPLYDVRTTGQRLGESVSRSRFVALALGGFSSLALLMAAVGLYGTIAHTVSQRRREIGIRMALGAGSAATMRLVVRQGLMVTVVGIACGLVLAVAASGAISSLVFGISTLDLPTLIGTAVALLLVALLACVIPARRALRVNPAVILKSE